MVIDTSAVIAILIREQEAEWFEAAILADSLRYMSAGSLLETSLVLDSRLGDKASSMLNLFLLRIGIEIVPVSVVQAEIARVAFRQYGRHKAGLNFRDCFSYALSKVSGEPLLFKGGDFGLTDLAVVVPPPSALS
jgi:ribonuclease VapC